ncbi:lipoxygenase [Paraphysoderma sedebokerense]|nr:lipoxygenase [Paraphysoderma sedebokerense]
MPALKKRQSISTLSLSKNDSRSFSDLAVPVPPATFLPNRQFSRMEFEFHTTTEKIIAAVFMLLLSPIFLVFGVALFLVDAVEKLYTFPFFRDFYHFLHSSVTFAPPPCSNGPPLALNPPITEIVQFDCIKTPWYLFRILTCAILIVVRGALRSRKVRFLSDDEFGDYIANSLFSQYLARKEPTEPDGEVTYVLTLDEIQGIPTFNGIFACGTETIFKRSPNGKLHPVSITLLDNGCRFYPTTKPEWKWTLSKTFVMQGLVYITIAARHPQLHFPLDAINVITKRIIPPSHPLYKLLFPHYRYTMVLGTNVINNKFTSSVYPGWWKPYAALACDGHGMLTMMEKGYKKWVFKRTPVLNPEFPYDYSLLQYYKCIRRFVGRLTPHIPRDDFIVSWADEISDCIPGFPKGTSVVNNENLFIDVLTMTIFSVSVHHNADHYSFSHLDLRVLPFRIRVPPPVIKLYLVTFVLCK